jgi:Family of unknown function (DUF6445)
MLFNPRPHIERVVLAPGREAWVVDDALADPLALRQQALRQRERFAASPHNAYPGLEWRLSPEQSQPLADFFMLHLRARLGARRTLSMYSRLSIATLQPHQLSPLQRLCHRDRFGTGPDEVVAACTLYLFDDSTLGGTAFYAPRRPIEAINADIRRWATMDSAAFTAEIGSEPGYLTTGNAHFELQGMVPAAFNRAVFYDGSGFHSSHITEPRRLSADPACGRLTLNGFFVCRRAAA